MYILYIYIVYMQINKNEKNEKIKKLIKMGNNIYGKINNYYINNKKYDFYENGKNNENNDLIQYVYEIMNYLQNYIKEYIFENEEIKYEYKYEEDNFYNLIKTNNEIINRQLKFTSNLNKNRLLLYEKLEEIKKYIFNISKEIDILNFLSRDTYDKCYKIIENENNIELQLFVKMMEIFMKESLNKGLSTNEEYYLIYPKYIKKNEEYFKDVEQYIDIKEYKETYDYDAIIGEYISHTNKLSYNMLYIDIFILFCEFVKSDINKKNGGTIWIINNKKINKLKINILKKYKIINGGNLYFDKYKFFTIDLQHDYCERITQIKMPSIIQLSTIKNYDLLNIDIIKERNKLREYIYDIMQWKEIIKQQTNKFMDIITKYFKIKKITTTKWNKLSDILFEYLFKYINCFDEDNKINGY